MEGRGVREERNDEKFEMERKRERGDEEEKGGNTVGD